VTRVLASAKFSRAVRTASSSWPCAVLAHPGEALEFAAENQVVRAVRGGRRGKTASPVVAANGATSAQVRAWARRQGYQVAAGGRLPSHIITAYNAAHR
jgi:hypothetical protein